MRATVVINPIAGPGRKRSADACRALVTDVLGRGGFDADIKFTAGPADAQRFAAAAVDAGHEMVVAWGGDGTVNGVACGLTGSDVALAIVPAGSGNGLARDLAIPLDVPAALLVAATGTTRVIDAGELNGSLFFNVAGIGLDASIAERLAHPGVRRGLLGYFEATIRELPSYRPCEYVITVPDHETGKVITTSALFIAIANSRQYGKGAQIAPRARLDDGLMDIVVIKPQSAWSIASRIPAFFNGTLREDDKVLMTASADAVIRCDHDIAFHVDGEPRTGSTTLVLRTRPAALRVRVNFP